MNKLFSSALLLLLAACRSDGVSDSFPLTGGDRDRHGCIGSAGQSWSVLRQQCIQPFAEADLKLDDPDNDTLAVYVLLSEDKSSAEVFAASLPEGSAVFHSVKGGYAAADGQWRLLKRAGGWKLLRR